MEPEPEPEPVSPNNKRKFAYEPEEEPFAWYLLTDYHESLIQGWSWGDLALLEQVE